MSRRINVQQLSDTMAPTTLILTVLVRLHLPAALQVDSPLMLRFFFRSRSFAQPLQQTLRRFRRLTSNQTQIHNSVRFRQTPRSGRRSSLWSSRQSGLRTLVAKRIQQQRAVLSFWTANLRLQCRLPRLGRPIARRRRRRQLRRL